MCRFFIKLEKNQFSKSGLSDMRYFSLILGFILFWFAIGFAVKNSEPVTLHNYLGYEWKAPLVVVVLTVFGVGVGTGLIATLGLIIGQKRELNRLRKEVSRQAKSAETPVTPNLPSTDAPIN